MADDPFAEKGAGPGYCPVDQLIGDHHITRMDRFLHGSHCTDSDNPLDPQLLHPVDVRPVVKERGCNPVSLSMAGEKNDI